MRSRRREVVFDKVEISKKTANVAEIYEKRRSCIRASRHRGLGGTNPITGGHQLPSGDGEGVDEGLRLESAPLGFSKADLCFAILINLIGNVSVSVGKFVGHM